MRTMFRTVFLGSVTVLVTGFAGHAAKAGPSVLVPGSDALTKAQANATTKVSIGPAEHFVTSLGDKAIGFMSNAAMNDQQKQDAIKSLLLSHFDMKTIGRFALGRYWSLATPQQREEYQSLFERMVLSVYSTRFKEYKGQQFLVKGSRPDGEKDTLVSSVIAPPSGQPIAVDWRVRNKDGKYMVVDVIVEGVSMSVTQRSDFSAVIQRGGGSIDVLLNHLRKS